MTILNLKPRKPLPWIVGTGAAAAVIFTITAWYVPEFVKTPFLKKVDSFKVSKPYAMTLSSRKEFYVTDLNGWVTVLSLKGQVLQRFKSGSGHLGGIKTKPPKDQEVYVANTGRTQILVMGDRGGRIAKVPVPRASSPHGLLFLPNGQFLVSDNLSASLMLFDTNNKYLRRFNTASSGKNLLGRTRQLAYDPPSKHVYVTAREAGQIRVYDLKGKLVRAFGNNPKSKGGTLRAPHGVAVDSKNRRIYVGDTLNGRIVAYDMSGNYMTEYKDKSFREPRWMMVDQSTGKLYVTSYYDNQIGVFELKWKW